MSLVFSDDFNDGTFNAWTSVGPAAGLSLIGCGGSYAFACNLDCVIGASNGAKILTDGSFAYTDGTIRVQQSAIIDPSVDPAVGLFITGFSYYRQLDGGTWVDGGTSLGLSVYKDGSLQVDQDQIQPTPGYSSRTGPGICPVDGSWHAIQFTISMQQGEGHNLVLSSTATVTIDNVLVATFTGIDTSYQISGDYRGALSWGAMSIGAGAYYKFPGLDNWVSQAVDNVEVDNTVNVTSYLPCAGTTPLSPTTCSDCGGTPPIAVGGMDIDCEAGNITITGIGFDETDIITLVDHAAIAVPFTIVSISSTVIVLHTNQTLTGRYCVTVDTP